MRPAGRFTPLRASLLFAAGFIVVRVGYRLLFGHASLAAAGDAVIAALPWAGVIVGFGLLSSLIDARKLLLRVSRLPIGRAFATALSIAVATVPALVDSVARVRRAQLLRGSRRRSAVLVPLLEHTVERAIALATALELRGFGGRQLTGAGSDAGVSWTGVSVRYGEREVLQDVTLECQPGTITVVTGPTGGGKTTLLDTITGLVQHVHGGVVSGSVTVAGVNRSAAPRDTAGVLGYVPQQLRMGWVASTVGEELAFSKQLHHKVFVERSERSERSRNAARNPNGSSRFDSALRAPLNEHQYALDIGVPTGQSAETLSAGQAVKLAIADALVGSPRVLVLDEPFADLDHTSRAELVALLAELAHQRLTIVLAEHHTDEIATFDPNWLSVVDGHVSTGRWVAPVSQPSRRPTVLGDDVTVELTRPQFSFCGETRTVDAEWSLRAGSMVALLGANGAGKSSLLRALAHPAPGTVRVRGADAAGKHPRPELVALVPEDVRDLFVCETLAEELTCSDHTAKCTPGLTELSLRSIIGQTDVDALLHTHPRDLSAGSQRALAVAIQLSFKPGLLLIDEPTRGLDPTARADMAETLRCVAETGCVVLFATHDHDWAAALTEHAWTMSDGELNPRSLSGGEAGFETQREGFSWAQRFDSAASGHSTQRASSSLSEVVHD
ncbi:MAG: ATP-binding cassette domain-containing protein [Microbacteriaceae bacterium]